MSASEKHREDFRARMRRQMEQNVEAAAKKDEDVKKAVAEDFKPVSISIPKLAKGEALYSDVFGLDPKDIGEEDFVVQTYHHAHKDWPDYVLEHLKKDDPEYLLNPRVTYDYVRSGNDWVFLVGDPGSGKTTLPERVGYLLGRPVPKQSFSDDIEPDEWIAAKEVSETGTYWKILPLVQCLPYPVMQTMDEFNRLRRGGRLLINRLRDGGTLQLRDGSVVTPCPEHKFTFTDNTRGLGDGLDKYSADVSDISTMDGYGIMLEVPYLSPPQQIELVKRFEPDMSDEIARVLVGFGVKIADGFKVGVFPLPFTPRRLRSAARRTMQYRNPVAGLRLAYYNFLADDKHRQAANQILVDLGIVSRYGSFH